MSTAELRGIHLFVRDVAATVAFYRLAGLEFDATSGHFARSTGVRAALEVGSLELTRGYDPAFATPPPGGATALQIGVESREAVDEAFRRLTAAGHPAHLAPFDAFWGSRYAEVRDPDGNVVGFQSPRDASLITPPPL